MMSVQYDTNNGHHSLSGRLGDALRKANEGEYDRALTLVGEIRAADPRNIYIIAFQHQIQKLRDLEHDRSPSALDERREILGSIPAVFERAVESARKREEESPGIAGTAKTEALEELKREFLKRADQYLEVGDYDHALAEIRRANIIQPNNTDAHHYEQRIEQIVALQHPPGSGEPPPLYVPPVREEQPPSASTSEGPQGESSHEIAARTVAGDAKLPAGDEVTREPPRFWLAAATLAALVVAGSLYLHLTDRSDDQSRPPAVEGAGAAEEEPFTGDERRIAGSRRANDVPLENIPIIPPESETHAVPSDSPGRNRESGTADSKIIAEVGTIEPAEALVPEEKEAASDPLLASRRLPSLIRFATPTYPEAARSARLQGEVKVRVQISTEGKPMQVRIVDSTNPLFNEAAIEAIMKSEFSPGMMAKGPVTSWVTIPIYFKRQ
ncbi:MAG: energy transducer TonB [Ignavibacteria bacterium]|nr:energy transducer TonB [Ignavibacteria bacterium]